MTSPSEAVAAREAEHALRAAMEQIPETDRQAINLDDLGGWQALDVFEVCDCRMGAMVMRRSRGLGMVRTLLRWGAQFIDRRKFRKARTVARICR